MKNEGPLAFWKGIPFAWGREGSYASIKLGAYAPVRDAIGAGGPNAPAYLKFLAGAITGKSIDGRVTNHIKHPGDSLSFLLTHRWSWKHCGQSLRRMQDDGTSELW